MQLLRKDTKIIISELNKVMGKIHRKRHKNMYVTVVSSVCRKSFLKKRRAAVVLQKHWRAYRQKQERRKV